MFEIEIMTYLLILKEIQKFVHLNGILTRVER